MLRARDEKIAEDQRIHLRTQEAIDRFFGRQTIGSLSLKEVLSTTGTPVRSRESGNERVIARIGLARDALQPTRAIHMRRRGDLVAFLRAYGVGRVMKGEGCDFSKYSPVASARMEGANGRKISRCLIRRLRISFISGRRGSATIGCDYQARADPIQRGPETSREFSRLR